MNDLSKYDPNKYLPVTSEYQKHLPVDNRVIDLPLFMVSGDSLQQRKYVIDESTHKVVEVSNPRGVIPRNFDQKVYFALVQVSIDFKNKIYNTLFKKIHELMFNKVGDYLKYFNEAENIALVHKRGGVKTLFEKIEFIKFTLENLDNNITIAYHLSNYNLDVLRQFSLLKENVEYVEIINKIISNKLIKGDLEALTKLFNCSSFVIVAKVNRIGELVNQLISGKIEKREINELLNDYDFLHSAEIIPTEIYFTYYEITKYLGQRGSAHLNNLIYESLLRMRDTKYLLWNCAYNATQGKLVDMLDCSFINSIEVTQKENLEEFKKYMEFTGLTKSNAIVKVRLEPFFINNLVEQKGHILFQLNTLMRIDNPTARKLYMYADKNRWWMGNRDFKTDKKIRLKLEELAARGIVNINNNSAIPTTIKVILRALDYLKDNNLILEYEFFKEKPQIRSYFDIVFAESRDINPINYQDNFGSPIIKQKTFKKTSPLKNLPDLFNDDSVKLKEELKIILQDFDITLTSDTIKLLNETFENKGIDYIKYASEYTKNMKPEDNVGYFIATLKKNHHEKFMFKSQQKNKIIEKENRKKEEEKFKKKLLEQQETAKRSYIESEYYKLRDSEKNKYLEYSQLIIKKYSSKLLNMSGQPDIKNLEEQLLLSIYAKSTGASYNYALEIYIEKSLGIKLNIYHSSK
ncbi:MAG: hypothetical protein KBD37_00245 [Burkholderiales bacterium]|nr:hypothetical protein [Burkholderiales bacterium]